MKSVTFFRLAFSLALVLGLSSSPIFSQDENEETPETVENQDRPQRGQGGGQRGPGGGQRGQRGAQAENLTPEERMKRINELIQKNVTEMAEVVELRTDQQEAFVKAQANYEVQTLKIRGAMQSAGRDREKRQQAMQQMQKLGTETNKAMKKILDKEQFKAFQTKMKERQPQRGQGGQRGPGGGGGQGRQ